MTETRRAVHAFVTDSAYAAWKLYAEEAGVSVTALVEAIGQEWAAVAATGQNMADFRPELVSAARRIDVLNRQRKGAERM